MIRHKTELVEREMSTAQTIEKIHAALGSGDAETARNLFDQVRDEYPKDAQVVADALRGGAR